MGCYGNWHCCPPSGVNPGSGLDNQNLLVFRLLDLDDVGLLVNVIDLVDAHPDQ